MPKSRRVAYGSTAHILNMFMYLVGLLPLTHLIVTLRPTINITEGERKITMVPVSFVEVRWSRRLTPPSAAWRN